MDNIKIGQFIKLMRMEKQMTQQQLADKLQVTNKAVSKWERGLNFPDITILEKLADELGVSVAELLRGEKTDEEEIPIVNTMHYADMKLKQQRKSNYLWVKVIFIMIVLSYAFMLLIGQYLYTNSESNTTEKQIMINDIFAQDYIELLNTFEGMYVGDNVSISYLFDELPLADIPHLYHIEENKLNADYKDTLWYLNDQKELYTEKFVLYNATVAFTCIHNMNELTMRFSDQSFTFTREYIDSLYNSKDLAKRINELETNYDHLDYIKKTVYQY